MQKDENPIYTCGTDRHQKAFDLFPNSRIAKSLQILSINNNIRQFSKVAMNL